MYKVINIFKDTDEKTYKINDRYNSEDEKRIEVLSTRENKYNKIFIVKDDEQAVEKVDGFDVTEMTVPQLKEALDQLNVEYKKSAKKDELIELLETEADKKPPKEGD